MSMKIIVENPGTADGDTDGSWYTAKVIATIEPAGDTLEDYVNALKVALKLETFSEKTVNKVMVGK